MIRKKDKLTSIGLVCVATFVLFCLVPATAADTGTYSEYTMQPETAVLDHFNSATSAAYTPNALTYISGPAGLYDAANFGEGQYARYQLNDMGSEGTAEMWVNLSQYNTNLMTFNWFNENSAPPAGYIFHLQVSDTGHITIGGWLDYPGPSPVSNSVIPLNQWTHIAYTWGPAGSKIYINGHLDMSDSKNWHPTFSGQNYAYLNYWGGKNLGDVDELRISRVAYTQFDTLAGSDANAAPVVTAGNDLTGTEGNPVVFSGGYTDEGDTGVHTLAWTFGDGASASDSLTPSHIYTDDGLYTVNLTVTDASGESTSDSVNVTIANAAPVISSVTVPTAPVTLGNSVSATAIFTDLGTADTHTAIWAWGDGSTTAGTVGEGSVSGTHAYTSAGAYQVTVTVNDDDGGTGTATAATFVVVYRPAGGFVTGGGWIQSPVGAYTADPCLTGKVNFGFVSKYKKGATVPTGETQFDFKAGSLDFHSTSYDWLVIAGAKAQYKGTGTINGAGNYGFMLTAVDGDVNDKGKPDLFRLKIWDKATGGIVYDNKMNAPDTDDPTTVLGGGSIVVHKT